MLVPSWNRCAANCLVQPRLRVAAMLERTGARRCIRMVGGRGRPRTTLSWRSAIVDVDEAEPVSMLRGAGFAGWERLVAAAGLALLIRGALHGGAVLLIAGAVLLVGSAARPALRWWRSRARITDGPQAAIEPLAAHH